MLKFPSMSPSTTAANLANVRTRISQAAARSKRPASDITLVAVTKTQPVEAILEVVAAGLHVLGENRVQEWDKKRDDLAPANFRCHLIGHLQSNKARRAATIFDRIDSLDSDSLAYRLEAGAVAEEKRLPVLIEVHLSDEPSKSGVPESDLDALADSVNACLHLDLQGLMTVPPLLDDVEKVRPYFRRLRELRDALRTRMKLALPVLSMGMSHDFEIAIEEGATEIRLGTALFGPRAKKP
jgi:PLP dependent protein